MKVLFYSPYLHILGGGEYHLFGFAHCLAQNHQVYIVCKDRHIITQAQDRFNLDLSTLTVIPFLPPRFQLKQFDLLFFVSDGSIPFLPTSRSILFFMNPFYHVHGRSLINQFKLKFINYIICNSYYTKKFIDSEFGVNSKVVYPSVNLPKIKPSAKENLIVSVGRFSSTLHDKNHSALIQAFIKLESQLPDWQLVLVGGTEPGSEPIVQKLYRQINHHRISLKTDLSPTKLHQLYDQAKLYWHAAGYDADLKSHPEKAEHFGISIVEAMGHGSIPLVFNAGGPTEILTPESGFTWNTLEELQRQTLSLINNQPVSSQYATAASHRAHYFSQSKLCQDLNEIISA